jgi:hypothetical protein
VCGYYFFKNFIYVTESEYHITKTPRCNFGIGAIPVANAPIIILSNLNLCIMAKGDKFSVAIKGFTYIKDYAFVTVNINDETQRVILGTKQEFPMADLFSLKQSTGVDLIEWDDKTVNGNTYKQFRLESINI